jgi:citronellol/citronellal dehydrogenase
MTVCILGASRGIGEAFAQGFAARGDTVVLAARTLEEEPGGHGSLQRVAAEIHAQGGCAVVRRCDVTRDGQIEDLFNGLAMAGLVPQVVIYAAGAVQFGGLLQVEARRVDLLYRANVRGAFVTCQECARQWQAKGSQGHILLLSPPLALGYSSTMMPYWLSKRALTALGLAFAAELASSGVAVNMLWPATLVDSQATRWHRLGQPSLWRKPLIMFHAAKLIVDSAPESFTGQECVDEDLLRANGTTDFDQYACVSGATPPRLTMSLLEALIARRSASLAEPMGG